MTKHFVFCDFPGCKNSAQIDNIDPKSHPGFNLRWTEILPFGSKNHGIDLCPNHLDKNILELVVKTW